MSNNAYSAFIPEIWSQKLNYMLSKDCVMLQCVNRNWEGEIKNQGDKVKIITPADVAISTLSSSNITYDELEPDRKSTRLNSSHTTVSRMPSSA